MLYILHIEITEKFLIVRWLSIFVVDYRGCDKMLICNNRIELRS